MITMKNIIREGHPTLNKRAEPVEIPLRDEVKETLREMRQFLINSQDPEIAEKYKLRPGVGLAAPQINKSLRMLAIYTEDENLEEHHDYLMVNPKVLSHSEAQTYMPGGEGCLSVDRDVEGLVPRHKKITVKTHLYDSENDTLTETTLRLKGFVGIVFQHELDHINGILFTEKVKESLDGIEPVQFKPIKQDETEEEIL